MEIIGNPAGKGGSFILKIITICALLFLFFGFGINAVYLIAPLFHFSPDRGQFWSISVLASVVLYLLCLLILRNWKKALLAYILINITMAGIDLILYFLFKNPYLERLIYAAFGFKWK